MMNNEETSVSILRNFPDSFAVEVVNSIPGTWTSAFPPSINSTIVSFSGVYSILSILGIKRLSPLRTLAHVLLALKICAKCALQ